jgi:MFS family permease
MIALLRRPDFRRLFVGVFATMFGESSLLLVLAIWVKELTGSSSLAGATLFAVVAPALAAPLLGWVVDRFRRRPFLIAVIGVTMVVLLPLLFVRDQGDVWIIYVVGFCYGATMLLSSAALNGLIKEMLPEELLADANGVLQTVRQGLRLVAPLGGAALLTLLGGRAVVGFNLGCLLIGGLALLSLKLAEVRPAPPELHWLAEVGAGLKHLFGPPALRRVTLGFAIAVTAIGLAETLVFAYVDQGLHRSPAFVSVIVCVQGVGGLSGGLLASRLIRRLGEVGTAALGVLLFAVGFGGFAYPNLLLGFVCAILVGLAIPIAVVALNTLLQRTTPAQVVGRVAAAAEAVIGTPQTLSIVLGAVLVTLVDYRVLFLVMAVVMGASASYLWIGRAMTGLRGGVVPHPREPLLDVDDRGVGQR